MITIPKACRNCGHTFTDLADWIGHRERTCVRETVAHRNAREKRESGRVYPMSGHRSWVDARTGRFTREERIWIYADNYRRNDRGQIVRPMPNLGGTSILNGITKLDQEGVACRLLERMSEPVRRRQAVAFGSGL